MKWIVSLQPGGRSVFFAIAGLIGLVPGAYAQIVPDGSTGTTVQPDVEIRGTPSDRIDGGTIRNNNLFHSFQDFNINAGRGAYFNNPAGIANIFSRVTGANVSSIEGVLGVLGDANLFFINPNGIIFGAGARLDVSGSFVGSTAESVLFDNYEFSASSLDTPPLLTIGIPLGLQVGANPGDIVVRTQPLEITGETFSEVADAGQLIDTAQGTNAPGENAPGEITGKLATGNDVDLYRLETQGGVSLSATTVGGTNTDTTLFLFDEGGFGFTANDDSVGLQSTLPAQEITNAGTFFIGVSNFSNRPVSDDGAIFSDGFGDLTPTGPGAELPLSGYTETGSGGDAYTIFFNVFALDDAGRLEVPAGQTLTLVGRNIDVQSGSELAPEITVVTLDEALPLATQVTFDANLDNFTVVIPELQTTPDNSLGAESSVVVRDVEINGLSSDRIDGGAIRGSNLFHSFAEFNVNAGRGLYFSNPAGVETILSRVTGSNNSLIDGTLGVLGNASLFLLNPNGLIFGEEGRLDLNGSFIGSTAESVLFENYEFSATAVDAPPLLTIGVPLGLRIGENPGEITVRSQPMEITSEAFSEAADAGDLIETAQATNGAGSLVPESILGGLESDNDVDLFQISLQGDISFSATTVGGTSIDTALFLFESDGTGIIGNDDSVGLQSTLPVQTIDEPGVVYLGVTSFANRPVSEAGEIFASGFGELPPTGPGGTLPLSGYTDAGSENGAYTIFLNLELDPAADPGRLEVPEGQTLALVGRSVDLANGQAPTNAQLVEIGDASSDRTFVRLDENLANFDVVRPSALPLEADTSLGSESSLIVTDVEVRGAISDRIDGGAIRGSNLFHSFTEFNVSEGRGVYFSNPAGIDLILSRVTGMNPSAIDGTLGVLGDASLFLLNPNGLIFGEAGRLDLNGSFVGSTAESILFEGYEFSATTPDSPPTLTGTAPIGLRVGDNPGEIRVRSQPVPLSSDVTLTEGTDVRQLLTDSRLVNTSSYTPPGRILGELSRDNDVDLYQLNLQAGSTFSANTFDSPPTDTSLFLFDGNGIGITGNDDSNGLILSSLPTQEITETGTYFLGVASFSNEPQGVDGDIFIREQGNFFPGGPGADSPLTVWNNDGRRSGAYNLNIEIFSGSDRGGLSVEPGKTLTLLGGDVVFESGRINAPDANVWVGGLTEGEVAALDSQFIPRLSDNSIREDVSLQTASEISIQGDGGGSLNVVGHTVQLQEGSRIIGGIDEDSTSDIRAGDITISASGTLSLSGESDISNIKNGLLSDAGSIFIEARNLALLDVSSIDVATSSNSSRLTGTIDVRVAETLSLERSSAIQNLNLGGTGSLNPIFIEAGNILLTNEGFIGANTLADGTNSGSIEIQTTGAISLQGSSFIANQVTNGRAGGLTIQAEALSLDNGSFLSVNSGVTGDVGVLAIQTTGAVTLENASTIATQVLGQSGNTEGLRIDAESISVTGGSLINALTNGDGEAGGIELRAQDSIVVAGEDSVGFASRVDSNVGPEGRGSSNGIQIKADSLLLQDGGFLSSDTEGVGDAGPISLVIANRIDLQGSDRNGDRSRITSEVNLGAVGNGGDIRIETRTLSLQEDTFLSAESEGQGNAGDITINAREAVTLDSRSAIATQTVVTSDGDAGTLKISAPTLSLEPDSFLSAASSNGNAGGITVDAENVDLDGATFVANVLGEGDSGAIVINAAEDVTLTNGSTIASQILEQAQGNSNGIRVDARQLQILSNSTLFSRASGTGNAGAIKIQADSIALRSGVINAELLGRGTAGDIDISTNRLSLSDTSTITASNAGVGNAGSILIDSREGIDIRGTDTTLSSLSALTLGTGDAGRIELNTPGDITVVNGAIVNQVSQGAIGNSAGIEITADQLFLLDGSGLSASTLGVGNAGPISIRAAGGVILQGDSTETQNLDGIQTIVGAGAVGNSAGIVIEAGYLTVENGSELLTSTLGEGSAGPISIKTAGPILFQSPAGGVPSALRSQVVRGDGVFRGRNANPGPPTISLMGSELVLLDGTVLSAETQGGLDAGTININVAERVFLGPNTRLSVETGSQGAPGDIKITAPAIAIAPNAQLSATVRAESTNTTGGGSISLNTADLTVAGELGIFAETNSSAPAGDLTVQPNAGNPNLNIRFTDDGFISTRTNSSGKGGRIDISATDNLTISGQGSITAETSDSGTAGEIDLRAQSITLGDGAGIASSTAGDGDAGAITVSANRAVELGERTTLSAESSAAGRPGNITVTSPTLRIGTDAELSATATATATNPSGGGSITLNTANLDISGELGIFAETNSAAAAGNLAIQPNAGQESLNIRFTDDGFISTRTTSTGGGGRIEISAPENLSIGGQGNITAETTSSGRAGEITLSAATIALEGGARILSSTSGSGDAGAINVEAENAFVLGDRTVLNAESSGAGRPGNITVSTPALTIGEDAELSATARATASNPNGGGSITLNTSELDISGELGIFAETNSAAAAGDLAIQPNSADADLTIRFTEEGFISTRTSSGGSGGQIDISAPATLDISGQGSITAETSGSGPAGNIRLSAESIEIRDRTRISASTTSTATGTSGDVTLTATENLTIRDGASVTVDSQGTAPGGNLAIAAENLSLIDGRISAETASTDGGNIEIQVADQLQLRDESLISTTAGTAQAGGNGGRININSPFVIAFPSSGPAGNDITANAFAGRGGSININTQGLIGIAFRPDLLNPQLRPTNDITVSSTLSISGAFNLTSPDVEPDSIVTLPDTVINASNLLAQSCVDSSYATGNQFILAGRGGLPPSPFGTLQNETALLAQHNIVATKALTDDSLESFIGQAQTLQQQGFYRKARALLASVIQDKTGKTNTLLYATALRQYGTVLRRLGDWDESREVLTESLAIAKTLDSPDDIAATAMSLGSTQFALGDTEAAITNYQTAISTATEPTLRLQALVNQYRLLSPAARTGLDPQIATALAQAPAELSAVYARLQLANLRLEMGANPEQFLMETLEIARSLPEPNQQSRASSYTLGTLGKLYLQQQRWTQAQTATEKALILAQGLNAPDLIYQWQWQLGQILAAQREFDSAIAAYSDAVLMLQSLRAELASVSTDVQFSFRDAVEPVYREFVALLLREKTPSQDNLARARSLIESLQLAELDNFFQDDCLQTRSQQLDLLDPTAAVIYPILLADRLAVVLSIPGQPLHYYGSPVSAQELGNATFNLQRTFLPLADAEEQQALSQQLYDWLVRPAEPILAEARIETLTFVLDGNLREIPMGALHDGESYLIERYNVGLAPSLELLAPPQPNKENVVLLAGGISEERQGFEALPQVTTELAKIAATIPGTQTLLNQDFTEPQLQTSVAESPLNVLHLATHGQFGSSAEETFIITWDERLSVKKLSQILQGPQTDPSNLIDLLVLSACETAAGDSQATLGMAGMAVRTGARTTIASLWSLNDDIAQVFMGEFYTALAQPETTKGQAFRAAQLKLLSNPQYASIYYWAPLVLIGGWQ
ncbi:MAG: filamentous hemagglutinin N-terminal domain-containing protein [Cyanobacteria bacterium P01_H01_bin.15]